MNKTVSHFSVRSIVIVLLAIALAYVAAAAAFALSYGRQSPLLAMRSPVGQGHAMAMVARTQVAMAMDPNQARLVGAALPEKIPPSAVALARSAFAHEPMSTDALGVLAMNANAQKHQATTLALFNGMNQLSRRVSIANLWLAQHALQRGDVEATLRYFDAMLRTSQTARETILQQFAAATVNPSFRSAMTDLLRRNPPWASDFWRVAPQVPGTARAIGELRLRLAGTNLKFELANDRELALKLVDAREFDLASKLYRSLSASTSDAAGEMVRNAQFGRSSIIPPIDWDTYSIGDFGSEIRTSEGALVFSAITSAGGAVAREWISLPPGRYTLRAKLDEQVSGGQDAQTIARLTCIDGQRVRDIVLKNGTTIETFAIGGETCRNMWLDIVAVPGEQSQGVDGALDYISVRGAGG
ncbi:MAG: hypothetical protein ABIT16_12775 [Croceibacterium sp.]